MSNFLREHEPVIRLTAFVVILVAMGLWEALSPRRPRLVSRWVRWPSNLGIVALNTVVLRAAFPVAAVGLAALAEQRSWGLLNNLVLARWASIVLAVVLFDLAIYLQHVMFHAVPALWRLHRMHHADLDFDVTTGARFHPVEIVLSMGLKLAVVATLGAPAVAVLIFEVVLNATAMFNHGNVGLPPRLDGILRWIVVTPDMHRVHHSAVPNETNSNFGFNLPWWDRLLGTYRTQPAAGHDGMTIGLDGFRDPSQLRLDRMLVQPLVRGQANIRSIGQHGVMSVARIGPRIILAVGLATAVAWAVSHQQHFDAGAIAATIRGLGAWAPLAYMGLYIAGTVLFLPGSMLGLAGGALFCPVWGATYTLFAATIGAILAFLLARYAASTWVAEKAGGRLKRLIEGVEAEGWRFVAFVRLVPLLPFNLLNYALGLTRIRLLDYVLASFVCMAPGTIAYTYLGYAGREALAGGQAMVQKGLLALGLLALASFLPHLVRRLRAGKAGDPQANR